MIELVTIRRIAGTSGVSLLLALSLGACKKDSSTTADGAVASGPAAAGSPSIHLNGFEGEVDVTVSGEAAKNGKPISLALFVKDTKVRGDIPPELGDKSPGKNFFILDGSKKELDFANDAKKSGMKIDLSKMGDKLKSMAAGGPPGAGPVAPGKPPKVTKTGKKDTVAGFPCENWDIEDDTKKDKLTVCVADEGFSWFSIPGASLPPDMPWAADLLDGKHFPLRGVAQDPTGKETGRMEVTKLEKKQVDAALFTIPPDYQLMDLGQMMGGMGALGAPPGVPRGPGLPGRPAK